MPIRKYKPTSPGRRFQTVQTFDDITSTEPHKPLIEPLKRTGGRRKGFALMAAVPLLEEMSGGPSGALIAELAGLANEIGDPAHLEVLESRRPERRLAIYPASAGFDLADELDYLSARTVEPNVFFNPRFLAPAMPRLEDREIRLAVIRDGDDQKSRLRLLVPFSVEKPHVPFGVNVMRTW